MVTEITCAAGRQALRRTSSSIARMIIGTPAMTMDIADPEARRGGDGVDDELGALRDARHAQPRLVRLDAALLPARLEHGARLRLIGSATPKALATQSAVMSSCVGPMPPVVKT